MSQYFFATCVKYLPFVPCFLIFKYLYDILLSNKQLEGEAMIQKVSQKVLTYLINKKVVSNNIEDIKYYQYGIEITVSSILNVLLIFFWGILFGYIVESIVFLFFFIPIRQFTGGFHAKTYFRCNLILSISYIAVLIVYYLTNTILTSHISILITFSSALIILFRCPIEHKNKPITQKKKKTHKIIAMTLCVVYGITGTALVVLSNKYGSMIIYTLSLVTMLIIAALIMEWRCEYESKKKQR